MADWVASSALAMDWSAAWFARSPVMSNAPPSTTITTIAMARNIFAESPNRIELLIAGSAAGVRLPEFVQVLDKLVATGVELQFDRSGTLGPHFDLPNDFGSPLMPGVQRVFPRRHPGNAEGSVARWL